jgi:hypothetical protein
MGYIPQLSVVEKLSHIRAERKARPAIIRVKTEGQDRRSVYNT